MGVLMSDPMSFIISGIQQVGIGIPDVDQAWTWYRKQFGMDIPVFQDEAEAPLMTRYTGDAVQTRRAVMALNLSGGSGMEIWQFTSRETAPPSTPVRLGDYGIFATRIKSPDVKAAFDWFRTRNIDLIGDLSVNPAGKPHFFVRDPFGLVFNVVEGGGVVQSAAPSNRGAGRLHDCSV